MSHGTVPGIIPGIGRGPFPRGMDRKGMEGKNADEVIHPQVEGADREAAANLPALPFPAMNEKTQQ